MDEPVKITLNTQQENSQNFAFLREEGLTVIQRAASETWTDHNIHDPGITLLENLSYALTEAGSLNGIDMPDVLASGELQAPQEFFTAADVLPSSPVSLRDFQKVLLDHHLVNRAWVSLIEDEPLGRISVLLEFEKSDTMDLNSNTVSVSVEVAGQRFEADFALPYWDAPELAAFQSEVSLSSIIFKLPVNLLDPPASPLNPPVHPWKHIADNDAYFTRIEVTYLEEGSSKSFEAWIVMKVTSPVNNPLFTLPQILQQAANQLQAVGNNSILKQYNRRVTKAYENTSHIRRYLRNYRNLCEIFAEFKAVRIQEVAFTANIEVAPNIDVETLLADIFVAVDNYISPEMTADSLVSMQKEGIETADIFEGPLTNYGFLREQLLHASLLLNKLYVSDIIRLIIQLRTASRTDLQVREQLINQSIIAVSNVSLSLYLDNRNFTTGAKDCLQLIKSARHVPRLSLFKCRVIFMRNNVEIDYDIRRVVEIFEIIKTNAGKRNIIEIPDLPLPAGVSYPLHQYYPVQNELPLTYGIGKAGLPQSASVQRKAQAKQLKGYLFCFEQILAGYFAQMSHINALFSADPGVTTTLYQQPLYHIPEISSLFVGFDPGIDPENSWNNFTSDENNPYRQVLSNAAENEEQFLDRRHRMLDHLLSRLGSGDEIKALSDLIYRQSYALPRASLTSPPALVNPELLQKIGRETSRRLLHHKADFYYELPYLDHGRAKAAGLPYRRGTEFVQIRAAINGQGLEEFGWQIQDYTGDYVLRHFRYETSETEARRKAEEAMSLATSIDSYRNITEPNGRIRIIVRYSTASDPSAVSINTFNTQAGANEDIQKIRQNIVRTWLMYSLAPLEIRLQHLLGLALTGERRGLMTPLSDYFEIFDTPSFRKRFRLRGTTQPGTIVHLESAGSYAGTDEANTAVLEAIKYGVFPEYYTLEETVSGLYRIDLLDADGSIIARSPDTYPNRQQAQDAQNRIREHLYRYYSLEGFFMIEHILFYPVSATAAAEIPVPNRLAINDSVNKCQPVLSGRNDNYSFLISFVFPSGYARDFNIFSPLGEPVRIESQPDRFRDPEFRAYAEITIRKACPAHILPTVLWIDRQLPGSPILNTNAPSFDNFENTYRDWMVALITDEPESVMGPVRNNMVTLLNQLHANLQ